MGDNQYNNVFKTVAVLLQTVFALIVIVIFSLMVNLFGKSGLSFRDIGNNDSFFDSYYYLEKIKSETKTLAFYLQMKNAVQGDEPEDARYKQCKLRFDDGESNFYYWFSDSSSNYTNMEGAGAKEAALEIAEKLGSYLYYDDASVILQGNFMHFNQVISLDILHLFQQSADGCIIIAVDESLPKDDALADAKRIYETYVPWLGLGMFVAIMSCMGFVLTLIYLTLAAGRSGEDEKMRLYRIDYLPTELLFAAFFVFVSGLIAFTAKLSGQTWGISSSLILTGTLVLISDAAFLALYLCFVRKIKAEKFFQCSITAYVVHSFKNGMRRRDIESRAKILFVACILPVLFFAWEAFAKKSFLAAAGLLVLFLCLAAFFMQQAIQRKKILEGICEINHGKLDYKFNTSQFKGDYRELAEEINGIGEGLMRAVEENVKGERLKTELITNVSHDIKTPLTSIINYIDLIRREGAWNENVENYVGILQKKSQRLKQLTEDLLEVSQITSGNITLDMQPINMVELICQTGGEFNEIFEDVGLTVVTRLPNEPVMILADGSRVWRVVQNLYNNVAKYALKDTRVFVELKASDGYAEFSIKDISAQGIHKTPQDLSERFVRGDESRGTEGSGLGLSIARNLTGLMGGTFKIELDGDLFTASITFPLIRL